jgi:glycerophosphoryl diester phosphodiesterase
LQSHKQIDIQGHRGARGLFPENTITAFIEAVKLGVTTLEMDVVISKDLKVVVSHEAWMNEAFCSKPDGNIVENNSGEKYNLYKMPYEEIVKYDCGKRGNKEFPFQKAIPEHKPLLSEVITNVESFVNKNNLSAVFYNIELKSESGKDGVFNPDPKTFVELVFNEIKKQNITDCTNLQSFDVRILQEIKTKYPVIKLALLVENEDGLEINLKRLGFFPDIYSPDFNLVNDTLVKNLIQHKIRLIPWTVNDITDMKKMLEMGVDGIITDYPDRAINLVKK